MRRVVAVVVPLLLATATIYGTAWFAAGALADPGWADLPGTAVCAFATGVLLRMAVAGARRPT